MNFDQFLPQPPTYELVKVSEQGFFQDVLGESQPNQVALEEAVEGQATTFQSREAVVMSRVPFTQRRGTVKGFQVTLLTWTLNVFEEKVFFKNVCFVPEKE